LNASLQNDCREDDILSWRAFFDIGSHKLRGGSRLQASTNQSLPDNVGNIANPALFGE
jgi:hypothetical protein